MTAHILYCVADRDHGRHYVHQFEDIHKQLESYVLNLQKEYSDRLELMELLEQGEAYYDTQYGEAKIVANVC